MSADLEVRGAEQLAVLAKALREVADKDLQRELYRGLNRVTKPVKEDIRKSAASKLPKRGGLADRVAKSKIATKRRTGVRTAGIRIVGTSGYDIKSMDRGVLRKPLFGNRQFWYHQPITPGWWTDPLEASADTVREELVEVLEDIAEQVVKKIR